MKFSIEMLAARLPDLFALARRKRVLLGSARIACGTLSGAQQPDYDDSSWETIDVGNRWGGTGQTCWLRVPLRVPEDWTGGTVLVHIQLGEYENLTGPEALAYLDGVPIQGIDFNHRDIVLSERVHAGHDHLLALEAFSSLLPGSQTLRALELVLVNPEAEAFFQRLEKRVWNDPDLPKWVGELYHSR